MSDDPGNLSNIQMSTGPMSWMPCRRYRYRLVTCLLVFKPCASRNTPGTKKNALAAVVHGRIGISVKVRRQQRLVLSNLERIHPRLDRRPPAHIFGIHEHHATSGHGSRGAMVHVVDFEEEAHGAREGDALIGSEGQHLVVIHHLHSRVVFSEENLGKFVITARV